DTPAPTQIHTLSLHDALPISDPVICLLEEQRDVRNKGASMRLGTWPTKIERGTLAEKIYGSDEVLERHRHRYEFNMSYRDRMRRSEEHTSELQSPYDLVCRLL